MVSDTRFAKEYARYYDLFYQGKDYSHEVDYLEEIFKKFQKDVRSILDLGCGTGLHTQELIKRGYEVTGLDLSEEMLARARERNPSATFTKGDMSNFVLNKKFDVIICMFSAMGYLTENHQIERFFRSIKNHLVKNGLLILDVWNGLGVMHELPSIRERKVEVDTIRIVRTATPSLDVKHHINTVRYLVKVYDLPLEKLITEYTETHIVRFFFPMELKKYMEDAGFELLHLCPSYAVNEELSYKHWNMVVVATH